MLREQVARAEAAAAAGPREKTVFKLNQGVLFKGLNRRSDLNGKRGTITAFAEEGKLAVLVTGGKRPVIVSPKNLTHTLDERMAEVAIETPSSAPSEAQAALLEAKCFQEKMLVARSAGEEELAARLALHSLKATQRAELLLQQCPLTLPNSEPPKDCPAVKPLPPPPQPTRRRGVRA